MSEADWRALKGICGPAESDAAEDANANDP